MDKTNFSYSQKSSNQGNLNSLNSEKEKEKEKAKEKLVEKTFDLLSHLKNNIKNYSKICEFHESNFTDYCLFCKQPICEVCVQSLHASHPVVPKNNYPLSTNFYERLFAEFEKEVKYIEETIQPTLLLKTFKKNIESEMNDLIEKLNDVKLKRLKEIDSMFISSSYDCKQLKNAIKLTKETIFKYINRNKALLDLNAVSDSDSFIFLQNYELANDCINKINNYIKLLNQVKTTYSSMATTGDNKFIEVSSLIDKILLDQKRRDIKKANSKIWQSLDQYGNSFQETINVNSENETSPNLTNNSISRRLMDFYNKINEDNFFAVREKIEFLDQFQESFRAQVYESIKKNQSLNEINKIVSTFEQKIAKKIIMTGGTRKISLNQSTLKSKGQLISNTPKSSKSKLKCKTGKNSEGSSPCKVNNNTDVLSPGTQPVSPKKGLKINLDSPAPVTEVMASKEDCDSTENDNNNHISNNDNKDAVNNNDSDKDTDEQIDVNMKMNIVIQEQRKHITKVIEKIFKPRQKVKNLRIVSKNHTEMKKLDKDGNNDKYKVNVELQQLIQENEKIYKAITSKEKVNLLIPVVRKFYSFNFLDYVRNNYSKLNNKKENDKSVTELYEFNTLENDPYKSFTVKIVEGTDEIQLYNKQTQKIQKLKVEFDIKKLNTKVFYKGCKGCQLQGKIYISGGKDFNGDKQIFLVYNIAEKKLSRLHDMKYPRSFHTFVYNESMRALIAIGGENNNSCEIYDFYLNMWNDFPELNYPRANVELILNSTATFAYALFGITGDIVNKQLSDVVEVIDLIDLNKGWYKLEYTNNTGVDLKSNCLKIEKLNDDKILLFGGAEQRNSKVVYIVLDLKAFEMAKMDLKQIEVLRKVLQEGNK